MDRISSSSNPRLPSAGGPAPAPTAATPATPALWTLGADALDVSVPAAPEAPPVEGAPDVPLDLTGLSEQEIGMVQAGFLPRTYATLKQIAATQGVEAAKAYHRRGLGGPFSPNFGDPGAMFKAAERIQKNPELLRLFKDIRKGDVLSITWNGGGDPISTATKGPFTHTMVCTSDGPPPEFIEAMGITGAQDEPSANRVRRCAVSDYFYNSVTMRLSRPTAGMAEGEANDAIRRAVRFCEDQLGKPYDYSFTNNNRGQGLTDAFYCSELAYLAYAKGAGIPYPLDKSPARDRVLLAADSIVAALDPKDTAGMRDQVMKWLAAHQQPQPDELIDWFVDELMPQSRGLEKMLKNPAQREQLKGVIRGLLEGKGFSRFDAAYAQFRQNEAAGAYNTPVLGAIERIWGRLKIGAALARDAYKLLDAGGLKLWQTLNATWKLVWAVVPNAESLAGFIFGDQAPQTQAAKGLLDRLDWLDASMNRVPLLNRLELLPHRAPPQLKSDFVSPSDLAWSPVPHWDYNVKAGYPIDRPAA